MLLLICKQVHLVCTCCSGEQLHISNEFGKARKVTLSKICSFIASVLSVSHAVHCPDSQESQLLLSKSWAWVSELCCAATRLCEKHKAQKGEHKVLVTF